MSYTVVYSDYNPYPGAPTGSPIYNQNTGRITTLTSGYNFTTGREPAILPSVNLFNSFSFTLYSQPGSNPTSTVSSGIDTDTSFRTTGLRSASGSSLVPSYGITDSSEPLGFFRVYKRPTSMEWVKTNGPAGNGVCRNERGDWITEEALSTADDQGNGIQLRTVAPSSPTTEQNIGYTTSTSTSEGSTTITRLPISATMPSWNSLRISGSYNGSVFCYNKFDYTNNNDGKIYTANSLYEMPERIDNIISFIPDSRKSTTLTFFVRVNWVLEVYNPLNFLSQSQIDDILAGYGSTTGSDIHNIPHVVNNTNPNWGRILNEIINDRQRSLQEQDARYGITFPSESINFG